MRWDHWRLGIACFALSLLSLSCERPSSLSAPSQAAKSAQAAAKKTQAALPSEYKTSAAGDVIEGSTFLLRLLSPTNVVAPGKSAKLEVELQAKAPWHVNLEYPVTVRMAKSDDWQETPLEITSEKALEYTQERARLAWEISSNKNGQFPVITEVAFAMCTPELCTLERQSVKTMVKVQ